MLSEHNDYPNDDRRYWPVIQCPSRANWGIAFTAVESSFKGERFVGHDEQFDMDLPQPPGRSPACCGRSRAPPRTAVVRATLHDRRSPAILPTAVVARAASDA